MNRPLLAIIGMLFVASAINADTLILKDGRRIPGQLISVVNGVVDFQEAGSGRRGTISREDVVGIEFGRVEEQPQASQPPARPRGLREKSVMVVANAAWSDTGIDVNSGQTIYLEATGEITWGPHRTAHPGGEENSPYNAARPMPNRPGAALIGRVGNSSDFFFIGDDRGPMRIRGAGRLFLGINDDNLSDNRGYFRVVVYY